MKEHLKAIVWPRETRTNGKGGETVYRYVIVGMLVTDTPLKFEGKNEILLDGPVEGLAEPLCRIKARKPRHKTGDAGTVLCELDVL